MSNMLRMTEEQLAARIEKLASVKVRN